MHDQTREHCMVSLQFLTVELFKCQLVGPDHASDRLPCTLASSWSGLKMNFRSRVRLSFQNVETMCRSIAGTISQAFLHIDV